MAYRCAKMVTATERSLFWLDYIPNGCRDFQPLADCAIVVD